jgi:hypothetical protein
MIKATILQLMIKNKPHNKITSKGEKETRAKKRNYNNNNNKAIRKIKTLRVIIASSKSSRKKNFTQLNKVKDSRHHRRFIFKRIFANSF